MCEDNKTCSFGVKSQYVDLAAEVFSLLSDATRIRII
ncbi:MAG: transcriptional regulator, partial [Corynebacterium flavescens]